ncbi:MAG: sulfatase, partial [Planctomycetia bacterium 21-64-5]
FPCVAPMFEFSQHGQCGAWVSELLPNVAHIVDDIAIVKSLNTEAINHDPATTYIMTGAQQPGRPSLGGWLSYGIGSENDNLPAFIVMISQGSGNKTDQPIFSRLWGSGFLPTQHQGVRLHSGNDPVLYLSDPPGIDRAMRRRMLDGVEELNRLAVESFGDPEIETRIAQYEMAYRMQASVPELTDLSAETQDTLEAYGIDGSGIDGGGSDGGFARNCLLARRMVERGVRFVQLMHRGWDQHGNLPKQIRGQCRDVDQPSAALVADLKARGLLDETLVIWGGEFGRTVYSQGQLTAENYGRDHHGRCFTMWLAGGGIKPGISYGETDDFCYNIVRDGMHLHDLNATLLECLGIDHTRLTFRFQGRDFRLTDVHGNVVKPLLA